MRRSRRRKEESFVPRLLFGIAFLFFGLTHQCGVSSKEESRLKPSLTNFR